MPLIWKRNHRPLATFCALLVLIASIPSGVFAQQAPPDFEAPLIEHDSSEYSSSESDQLFSVNAADNIGINDVRLFYRYRGEPEYRSKDMIRVSDSSEYTARISVEDRSSAAIEYYIQAEDMAGNVVLKGYSFAPLERVLALPMAMDATVDSEPKAVERKPRSKALYYILGALAVGAVAGLAGGGGSGSSPPPPCGDAGCLVTFTLGSP